MSVKLFSRERFTNSVYDPRLMGYILTPKAYAEAMGRKARGAATRGKTGPVECEINPRLRHEAEELARWAANRWGIEPPTVKFFDERAGKPPTWAGFFSTRDPGSIWLRSSLRGAQLADTVLHETSHYARHLGGHPNTEHEVKTDTACLLMHLHHERTRRWASYEY